MTCFWVPKILSRRSDLLTRSPGPQCEFMHLHNTGDARETTVYAWYGAVNTFVHTSVHLPRTERRERDIYIA